ncbi:iron-siderophore ABC transporter substrate-binding protein [Phaeobacter sp.]|uniref:iron-siderophore ABC transporter substrate-binding protein n=1 Tax=Phaeobacter sp. TaxID=1902409 RepID=UPI0025D91B6B|nr:iron-siderophore ABC transporter substrate-binding protein [Phaeobacter sp.]
MFRHLLLLALACVASACFATGPAQAADPTQQSAQTEPFPVEITHRYGTTRIGAPPQRIVSIGFIDHDFLLSLGIRPYALRNWYGGQPFGVWPWAQEALGEAEPIVMHGEIDIEQIVALQPDLIVGQWSGITRREYQILSQIAPTLPPQPGFGDYGMPWQEMLRTLGRATGTSAKAAGIIADLDARFAAVRRDHPDWAGQSAAIVWAGQTGAYTARDIRGRFLENLGFVIPDTINTRGTMDNFYILIPDEDLSPIDVDALLWIDGGGTANSLHAKPLRTTMRAHKEGREVYINPLLSAALSHSSPLSLSFALDHIVPLVELAADGDPATIVPSSADIGITPDLSTVTRAKGTTP